MMRLRLALALALAGFALGACGDDDGGDSAAPATPAAESAPEKVPNKAPKPAGTELVAADSQYGRILFDSEQRAIYLFDKERSDRSQCYGDCAAAWPPVLTEGEPQAGDGIDAKLLGTTERDDGSSQLTYAGHPLYYYVDDPPGQVLCQNVEEFGGLWLVVDPRGQAVL